MSQNDCNVNIKTIPRALNIMIITKLIRDIAKMKLI